MSDLIIVLLIIIVTILFLLEVYAPPRREKNPNEPKHEAIREPRRARQVQRVNPLKVFRSFTVALFGGDDPVKTFEGEQILHRTGRHWIMLLIRGFVPFLIVLLVGGLIFWQRSTAIRAKDKKKPKPTLGIGFLPELPYIFGVGLLSLM